jgi:hypothetical protein
MFLNWDDDANWIVVEVDASTIINLDGKVKYPSGTVVHVGDINSATNYIATHGGAGYPIVGYTATAGYQGTATAGYQGTATAGDRGTATAGDQGTATAGDGGTATAGYQGTATVGDGGTATAGDGGILQIRWWDGLRVRICIGYVGEGGIQANVAYRCDNGRLVLAED